MNKPENRFFFVLLLVLAGVGVWLIRTPTGTGAGSKPMLSFGGETMGTTYKVKLVGVQLSSGELALLKAKVDEELEAVNDAMSTYLPESEISRFNRLSTGETQTVSPRFFTVLARSFELYEQSGGAFDPTLGPLIDLWGFGAAQAEDPPTPEVIEAVLRRVGMSLLTLEGTRLRKEVAGVEINLSAIAKGYGVDRVAALLSAEGFENIYVEIGGELVCKGVNALEIPWRIGIQVPDPEAAATAREIVALENMALATSGDYRNFVVDDAGLRHHILDPRHGRPARHTLASVSVIAADCMTADAVATALFVMGTEEGMDWVGKQQGLEALFIDRDGADYRLTSTPGFKALMVRVP